MQSWQLGLKANALYRDGSKLSQPLSSALIDEDDEEGAEEAQLSSFAPQLVEKVVERIIAVMIRQRLPTDAKAIPKRPALADIRFICGQANMKMAVWARFSSICIKKAAQPSAR